MTILSRYVLWQFLRLAGLCQVGAIVLFLIAEFIERIDDLIEKHASFIDGVLYFAFRIPQLIVLSIPVTVLLACVLSLILLSRGNEVVAMRACGSSIYQIIAPILLASLGISALNFYLADSIVPYANQRQYYIWRVHIKKVELRSRQQHDRMWYRSEDNFTIWQITHYDPKKKEMSDVTLYRLDGNNRLVERVDAAKADWDTVENEWQFKNGIIHRFGPEGRITSKPFKKKVFALRDWPKDFEQRVSVDPEQMSFRELRHHIRALRRSGVDVTPYAVDMWSKLSAPLISFVLALVGIPFSLKSGRSSGVALGVATAVGIGAIYLILFYTSISLGHAGRLPPLVAAWGPNAIFLGGGTYLLTNLRS